MSSQPQPAPLPDALVLSLHVTDREVIATLAVLPEGRPREDFARHALRIGVLALEQARGRIDAETVRHEGDRLVAEVARALGQHQKDVAEKVARELRDYFDPESGRFSDRVRRLVSKDGELESVLRKLVGQQDSELSRTLASHLGDGSAVMKALDPQAANGVVMTLQRGVQVQLDAHREHIVGQFSLDKPESALSKLVHQVTSRHGDLEKSLSLRIEEVVKEFTLDNKDSALSRLVAQVDGAQQRITKEFTLDNRDSALARMRDELTELLKAQAKASSDFQSEVKATLSALQSRREAEARSTTHGVTFEAALRDALQEQAARCHDVLEETGSTTGLVARSKVGDFVIRLGADCKAAGARIVVEAKESESYSVRNALDEIEAARKNRGCEIGLFVWSRRSAPAGVPPLERHGCDVLVVWDSDAPETDAYLHAAVSLARALCTRGATERERQGPDLDAMAKAIREIENQARLLGEMEVPATTIKNNADKILDRMRATKDSLGRQVKTLDELMEDLRGA